MSVSAACPLHAPAPAEWTCRRCGTFFCEACAYRVRPDAPPMCGSCWEIRSKAVQPQATSRTGNLQTAGLVVGFFGLVPNGIFQLIAGVVCILGLVMGDDEAARRGRWKSVVGLVLTGIGTAIFVWLIVAGAMAGG